MNATQPCSNRGPLRLRTLGWTLLGLFYCTVGATISWAQQGLRDIPTADPAIEKASFELADGWEVNLFAADPLLAKPTQIQFDRQGRLWVACSETYPQLRVDQEPQDRILLLEDVDGDGQADRSQVFHDQLIIPGGVLPDGRGGAYVAHAEELLHLHDDDGDGRADREEVLLAGFGTEDTHHTLHRLCWGPGGLMYMMQGYYIGTHVETLYGPRRLNGGGLWWYDTRRRQLEILSRGLTNPWGVAFGRYGQVFQTDGAGGEGINFSFPDAVFRSSPYENRFLRGLNPGRPKSCGLLRLSGGHVPPDWQGDLITSDFRANNIDRYRIRPQGSGFVSELMPDLIRSTHVSFRPIDMVMGPDGAIYVADWYSPIIQHGEVDFRDPRRDQVHGRIWRLQAKGRPLVQPVDYAAATIGELLDLLKSSADWVRLNAKQELKTRDEAAVERALGLWLAELEPTDPAYESHRLEGLWTYQTISTKRDSAWAEDCLASPDPHVRAAAVRLLYFWGGEFEPLARAANDPEPPVRREAVSALGRWGQAHPEAGPRAVTAALAALDQPLDPYLDFALWRTCRNLAPLWVEPFRKQEFAFAAPGHAAFALTSAARQDVLDVLIAPWQQPDVAPDPATVELVGQIGAPNHLAALADLALGTPTPRRLAAAQALLQAVRLRGVQPQSAALRKEVALKLLTGRPAEQGLGARLAGYWKVTELAPSLSRLLTESREPAVGQAAAEGLAELNEASVLRDVARNASVPENRRLVALEALLRLDAPGAVPLLLEALQNPLPPATVESLFGAVVSRVATMDVLERGLAAVRIHPDNADYAARVVETSGDGRPSLRAALTQAGQLAARSTTVAGSAVADWLPRLAEGDAARGREVFAQDALGCVKCHRVGGNGGEVGPDLSSVGAAAPADYLVESLLQPSAKIKEGYRMAIVQTEDGAIVSGTVLREDATSIVVRTATAAVVEVPRREVAERSTSPVSMMPSGVVNQLTPRAFLDLVAYLRSLGR